ncbi:MAG: hypothetical protein QG580_303 [Patescibacteria group bacterium]|jgi:hypothetical protein|nr:hypothetical protein [Patescibacteria group bacterium]
MVKFYRIKRIEIDEQKIKDGEPIEVDVITEYGHESTLCLVFKDKTRNSDQNTVHLSFEFPVDHPLHDHAYIFGYYDLTHREGKLRVYHQ